MQTNDTPEEDCMFGLVINPKDGRLYQAYRRYGSTVYISMLRGNLGGGGIVYLEAGKGYFNEDENDEPSNLTGLPRVHTPAGVGVKGAGLGTVLYTSLCFAAHLSFKRLLPFNTSGYDGDGICSDSESRGYEASKWWSNATRKYGLAKQVYSEAEVDASASWEDNESDAARRYIDREGSYHIGEDDYRLNSYNVTVSIEYTKTGRKATDVYMFDDAKKHNLPVTWFDSGDRYIYSIVEASPGDWRDVNVSALVNANLSDLNPDRGRDMEIAFGILAAAKRHGASAKDVDFMLERFRERIDVEMKPDPRDPQFQESITRYDLRASGKTILHPSKKIGRGIGGRVVPRKMVWAPVSASGRVSGAQSEKLSRLAEARRRLGWDAFQE